MYNKHVKEINSEGDKIIEMISEFFKDWVTSEICHTNISRVSKRAALFWRQPEKPKGPEVFDLWSTPTKAVGKGEAVRFFPWNFDILGISENQMGC